MRLLMRSPGLAFSRLGAFMGACGALLAAVAVASPAAGENQAPAPREHVEEIHFSGPEWFALVEGKTLYYKNMSGGFVGREYYVPGSRKAVFIYFDGSCYEGSWSESDGVFQFRYDGDFYFRHIERGGVLIAAEVDGPEQVVVDITNEVLSCDRDLSS
ncbi:MAG: hypothetical protein AAFZ06_02760 [Pseudomonadota bacterium]